MVDQKVEYVTLVIDWDNCTYKLKDAFGLEIEKSKYKNTDDKVIAEIELALVKPVLPILIQRTVYNKMPAYKWGDTGEPFPYNRGDRVTQKQAQLDCFQWAIDRGLWEGDPERVL